MLFSLITLLTVVTCFVIFLITAKFFLLLGSKTEVKSIQILPKFPKKADKETEKKRQKEEALKFNIDNFSGYGSPEREVK